MLIIKKIIATAIATLVSFFGLSVLGPMPVVAADTPNCATYSEWQRIDVGVHTRSDVARIFDIPGRIIEPSNSEQQWRTYNTCDDWYYTCVKYVWTGGAWVSVRKQWGNGGVRCLP